MNLHHVNAEHTRDFYRESLRRWPEITKELNAKCFETVRKYMLQLAEEFGSSAEKREFREREEGQDE